MNHSHPRQQWWMVGLFTAAIAFARWLQLGHPALAESPPAESVPTGKLVCVGASVTLGEGAPTPAESYVGRLRARAAAEHVPLVVVNEGRSGWSTGAYAANAADVAAKLPTDTTIVTILLGTNDVRTTDTAAAVGQRAEANLAKLVAAYEARLPTARVVIVTPTAIDVARLSPRLLKAGYGPQAPADLRAITAAFHSLAARLGVTCIDLSTLPSAGHTVDGVHPDAAGHAELADAIWAGLATAPATRPTRP